MKKSIIILAATILIACGNSDRQKADALYLRASKLYETKTYDEAKRLLDTLHTRYPRQVESRKRADTLLWRITLDEVERDIPIVDSTLRHLLLKAETIAKDYRLVKDAKYQTVGDYEHKNMQNASNASRTYLKPIADEQGNFSLISNLVGHPIAHRQLTARVGDISASTPVADDAACNKYNDFGVTYEQVIYRGKDVDDIVNFFSQNTDKNIEIVLNGEQKDYSYKISKSDVKIIVQTYDFAKILEDIYRNQTRKAELTKMYNVMTLRLSGGKRK